MCRILVRESSVAGMTHLGEILHLTLYFGGSVLTITLSRLPDAITISTSTCQCVFLAWKISSDYYTHTSLPWNIKFVKRLTSIS